MKGHLISPRNLKKFQQNLIVRRRKFLIVSLFVYVYVSVNLKWHLIQQSLNYLMTCLWHNLIKFVSTQHTQRVLHTYVCKLDTYICVCLCAHVQYISQISIVLIKYIDPKQLVGESIYFGLWYQRKRSPSRWWGMAASDRNGSMSRKLRDHISNHMLT